MLLYTVELYTCYFSICLESDYILSFQYVLCSMAQPAPCRVCKSRCATSLATATLFGIYFQPCFVPAAVTNYMTLLIVCSFDFVDISTNAFCVFLIFSYTDRPLQCKIGIQ